MDMNEFVMRDCCKLHWMQFARFFGVHPVHESVHQNLDFSRRWWNVIADVNLSSSEDAALNRIDVSQYSFMNLEYIV